MKGTWQNLICIFAALWLCISPLALHFKLDSVVSDNMDIVGAFIGVLSIIAMATHHLWEHWTKVILGVWLLASPWFLEISHHLVATRDIMTVGIVVVILSLWSVASRLGVFHYMSRHPPLPPTASELLIQTMNLQRKNTDAGNPS